MSGPFAVHIPGVEEFGKEKGMRASYYPLPWSRGLNRMQPFRLSPETCSGWLSLTAGRYIRGMERCTPKFKTTATAEDGTAPGRARVTPPDTELDRPSHSVRVRLCSKDPPILPAL